MAAFPSPPSDGVIDWAAQQHAQLLSVFAAVDPARPVWAFGRERPGAFWWRRQAHETVVHAWDATTAAGGAFEADSDMAMDGVDELVEGILPGRWKSTAPDWGAGRSVHLHRTDGDGEWLIEIGSAITRGHAKGDLAVRGRGVDLLWWVTNRGAPAVELLGDASLAAAWKANVAF